MQQTTPPRARFPAIEREDDIRPPPPPLTTWRKERYDPFAFQSLSASGPLRLVLRPDSAKKRPLSFTSSFAQFGAGARYDPFAFQSLSASSQVSVTASLGDEEDYFHSPPPPLTTWRKERYDPFAFQSLSASGPLRLVLRPDSEKKRPLSFTSSFPQFGAGARYDPFAFQSLSASGPHRLVSRPASEMKRTTFIHLLLRSPPGGRSAMIHSPSSPSQPLDLSG